MKALLREARGAAGALTWSDVDARAVRSMLGVEGSTLTDADRARLAHPLSAASSCSRATTRPRRSCAR